MARASEGGPLRAALSTIIRPQRVKKPTSELGVVTRGRKVDATAPVWMLVWTLVLSFESTTGWTIEAIELAYEKAKGRGPGRLSFSSRLTRPLAKLLRRLTQETLEQLIFGAPVPEGYLAGFRDFLAMDATVLRLHELPGAAGPHLPCLSGEPNQLHQNYSQVAATLPMVMSVVDGSPNRVGPTSQRVHDTLVMLHLRGDGPVAGSATACCRSTWAPTPSTSAAARRSRQAPRTSGSSCHG